jgi:hypothetical protein
VQALNPLEAKIEQTASAIHTRHPAIRQCGIGEVRALLVKIVKRVPAAERLKLLNIIDENHRASCATSDWQKEDGQFAKGLDNWLAPTKERYLTQPAVQHTAIENDYPEYTPFEARKAGN